ncbi:formylglycine-generating enzyme family protein [Piscinibacter sakaiensis]|uniref:formylglycine-generating enzyme family protein n=1 Tax=Piscinibacter sakaiensis TaxID=1547922 RepID=UPI003F7643C3
MLLAGCAALPAADRPPAHPAPAAPAAPPAPDRPDATPPVVVNRLGMVMQRLPAGVFTMGRSDDVDALARRFPGVERARLEELGDEQPAHEVRLTRPFYMARHEVTVGQFRAFLAASGHVPESIADGTGAYGHDPSRAARWQAGGEVFAGRDPRWSWADPGFPQRDDHPVVNVTWNDAQAMARWLSATEGRRYRLPTEAEWEYACRAGSRGDFHTGDGAQALAGAANVFDADAAPHWPPWQAQALPVPDGHVFTAPVGSYPPNAFGLFDLHGNVWEWTADWYAEDAYAHAAADDPAGPASGRVRVRRGGSWHTWPVYARCAYRNVNSPSTRYVLVGIRLVMDADPPGPGPRPAGGP